MQTNFKKIILIVFFSLKVYSEEGTLTLKQFINESLQSSPVVQKAQFSADEQSWKKVEARSTYLPSVYGSVNYLTQKKYGLVDVDLGGNSTSIPQIVPTTQYTLSARWTVFDGFSSTYKYLAASTNSEAADLDYDWAKFQIERQAILAFYKVLAAEQVEVVGEQNLKALKDHSKDIEALKKVGSATRYDVLRTQVQVSEAETELINAKDQVEFAKTKLAEILGVETESRRIQGVLPTVEIDTLKKVNKDVYQKLDLKSLSEKTEAARQNYQSINKHWLPKISLFADYNYYNNRNDHFQDSEAFRDSHLIGATLSWSFFDGFGAYARSSQAFDQYMQIQKNYQIAQVKAKTDLEFWRRKLNYYISLNQAKSIDIERTAEALKLAKLGKQAGVRTNTDILEAQTDSYRSKAALIHSQIGAIESIINIELSTGIKIFEFKE